jgi:hypothetical protein
MFPRYNRLVDSSPKCTVHRSDVVSRPSEAARLALKGISGWSIGFGNMAARRASTRRVSRINKNQRNTSNLRFVLNEHPKQSEIPSMQATTLSPSNRGSVSNALKIFKSDRPQSVFGFRNYLLGNAMVDIFRESGHSARELLEMSLGRLGTFGLKPGFQRIQFVSGLVDLLSGMHLTVRINSKVLDTEIDTKNSFRVIRRLFGYFDHNAKVKNSFDKDQVSLPSYPIHPSLLIIPDSNRDKLSAFKGDQRDGFQTFPGKDSLIIDDSPIKLKFWFDGFISLVGFGHFGYCSNRKLRGEPKPLSGVIIDELVNFNLIGLVDCKSSFRDSIARFVKAVHGIEKHLVLLFARIKLDHQGLKHCTEDFVQLIYSFRYLQLGTLLPGLKTGVSATPAPWRTL